MNYYMSLLLSRKEKEQLVIKLTQEGKTTREIAKQVHVSLRDIGKIQHKLTGDNRYFLKASKKNKMQRKRNKKENLCHHMLKPFKCSKIRNHLKM